MNDDGSLAYDYQISRFLQTAEATLINPNTPENVRVIVRRCVKNILLNLQWMSTDADDTTRSIIIDMMEQSFFIGRYAPTADLAAFIEAINQQERGKKGAEVKRLKSKTGWRLIARHLALELGSSSLNLTANRLANAVIAAWKGQTPHPPDIKTVALFVKSIAAEPGSPINLKTDRRAK